MNQATRRAARAHAIAQARPAALATAWWLWILLALAALSAQALAQDNAPPATLPTPGGAQAIDPNAPAATTGVIRPPAHVDPGIKAKPPVPPAALPTPVIPPPGSTGGLPVQPK